MAGEIYTPTPWLPHDQAHRASLLHRLVADASEYRGISNFRVKLFSNTCRSFPCLQLEFRRPPASLVVNHLSRAPIDQGRCQPDVN